MKISVLDIGFDNFTKQEAVSKAMELIAARRGGYAVTPNPEIVWLCRKNNELKVAIEGASIVLADGIGIIKGAAILKTPLKERIPGIDYATALMSELAQKGGTVFLLGAKPGIAEKAAKMLEKAHKDLRIIGVADGYFKDEAPIVESLKTLDPDLILVCLGSPKQELFMARNKNAVRGMMIGLGGSLDVYSGMVERAPEKWRKLGLEWLYRLIKEPKRIGRMMKLPLFLIAVLWRRVRGRKG